MFRLLDARLSVLVFVNCVGLGVPLVIEMSRTTMIGKNEQHCLYYMCIIAVYQLLVGVYALCIEDQ